MNDEKDAQNPSNPAGVPISNPFENHQTGDRDVQEAAEELDKEQQFKEAQTERE